MDRETMLRLCQLLLLRLEVLPIPAEVSVQELLAQVVGDDPSVLPQQLGVDEAAELDATFKQLAAGSGYFVSSTAAAPHGKELPVNVACFYHKLEDIEQEFDSVPENMAVDQEADIACISRQKEVQSRYGAFSAFLIHVPAGKATGLRLLRDNNTILKLSGSGFAEYLCNRRDGCRFGELGSLPLVLDGCEVGDSFVTPWYRIKNNGSSDLVLLVEKAFSLTE